MPDAFDLLVMACKNTLSYQNEAAKNMSGNNLSEIFGYFLLSDTVHRPPWRHRTLYFLLFYFLSTRPESHLRNQLLPLVMVTPPKREKLKVTESK